ncbi:MAG: hypothetical protein KKE37_07615 [Verrucomicrobia bacterium]|nr:hypothetical protein [Verrucomicrobiota bacterium]MBU4274144.1 hypothetical protein [Planctomycetota bacterium]MBU4429203.1 hypothetical protein [Verrucomicrobiota bacterium]MCG2680385.1 hypothetical protein [Kiritimatiellia bacterium]
MKKIVLLSIIPVIMGFIPSLFAGDYSAGADAGFNPAALIKGKDAAESFEKYKKVMSRLNEVITSTKEQKKGLCAAGKASVNKVLKEQEKGKKDTCQLMTEIIKESIQNLSSETDVAIKAEKLKELNVMLVETKTIASEKPKNKKQM